VIEMNVLVVGGSGREHAIAWTLAKNDVNLFAAMNNRNPGIIKLCKDSKNIKITEETNIKAIAEWAKTKNIDLAVIGLEDPLGCGITDELKKCGISTVGPTKAASQLEMSKEFSRNLLERNKIKGRIDYKVFDDIIDAKNYIESSERDLVIKPIGLTGGKGVKIMGEHLATKKDAIEYVKEIIKDKIGNYSKVLVEEKLYGEEFTLQCFVDGKHIVPMPAVQDHKRAYDGDIGPNTGGMGSYSQSDGLLPFLKKEEYEDGVRILKQVVEAMRKEGREYKGTLYGQFMLTSEGLKVIEFNARFGDPEAMNVLPLLNSNFIDICWDIVDGNLSSNNIKFTKKATVCKYVVPLNYGTKQVKKGELISIDEKGINDCGAIAFTAKLNEYEGKISTTSSRSIAFVGIADEIEDAEKIAENAIQYVKGDVYSRHDIGKQDLILKRIRHMKELRQQFLTEHKLSFTNKGIGSIQEKRGKQVLKNTIEINA
jgi:phosphoribosylamine--glycine ligase